MRVMGLDVGSKTVGVAISDPLGWTAQGVETIAINEAASEFGFNRVVELVKEYEVEKIVIGMPKNMNNTAGPRAEASQKYGRSLEKRLEIPIVFHDERLTTMQAERMLVEEANVSRKKRKEVIDKLAAVIILQNYLDLNIKQKRGNKMTEHTHEHDGHEHITIIDEEGNEVLHEVLFTFDSEDFGKSYVLVYPAGIPEGEEVELQAFSYVEAEDGTEGDLLPIETDEEWDMIEEVLNTFLDEEEE